MAETSCRVPLILSFAAVCCSSFLTLYFSLSYLPEWVDIALVSNGFTSAVSAALLLLSPSRCCVSGQGGVSIAFQSLLSSQTFVICRTKVVVVVVVVVCDTACCLMVGELRPPHFPTRLHVVILDFVGSVSMEGHGISKPYASSRLADRAHVSHRLHPTAAGILR